MIGLNVYGDNYQKKKKKCVLSWGGAEELEISNQGTNALC